jgi:hypothetical protein
MHALYSTLSYSPSGILTTRFVSLCQTTVYYENLEYSGLSNATGFSNATGYASADLQLMTLQYDLFQFLPFKFCGDWVTRGKYNFNSCPGDGKYHFEVPYVLPKNDDATTWFATGWEGVSYLKIYADRSDNSPLLSHCKIHFKTSVTQSNEENWRTLPSAAQTTLILFGIAAGMFSLIICMACRTKRKHPTDEDYSQDFKKMEDPAPKKKEEVEAEKPEESIEERVHKLSLNMDYSKV